MQDLSIPGFRVRILVLTVVWCPYFTTLGLLDYFAIISGGLLGGSGACSKYTLNHYRPSGNPSCPH